MSLKILRTFAWMIAAVFTAGLSNATQTVHHRALLIGINDYTASRLPMQTATGTLPNRDWPNLTGAVNDVHAFAAELRNLYGFDDGDIVTLTDQEATRDAILDTIDHYLTPGGSGDVVFFYFAGHGSQVRNSSSDELDKLDESIIPADSRRGAKDIRDKELRKRFNAILDSGAQLTIVLDSCHSGSGVRGPSMNTVARGIRADLRDVADPTPAGPSPEKRGALVLTASHEFDQAWETRDERNDFHGVFSWALLRSIREAPAGEPAIDTFLRAEARMSAETPYQEPVIAADNSARMRPLLGVRSDQRDDRTLIGVSKAGTDGTLILKGGWANGLAEGTELRLADSNSPIRFKVTELDLGRSKARIEGGESASIRPGMLLEVVGWTVPRSHPLRLCVPVAQISSRALTTLARKLAAAAAKAGVRWVADPTVSTPARWLRPSGGTWELAGPEGERKQLVSEQAVIAATADLPAGSSLFVQFPVPATLLNGSYGEGIELSERRERADYVLEGRYSAGHLAYAWVRPMAGTTDRAITGLPMRTSWVSESAPDQRGPSAPRVLRDAASRLRKIHAWSTLETPPRLGFSYHLTLRPLNGKDGPVSRPLAGGERYQLVLQTGLPRSPRHVAPRYVYAFAVDSDGKSVLLYPVTTGSADNRFPLDSENPAPEIPIGEPFEVGPPYGTDTYFLLSTADPLPNPWILEWDGVRSSLPQNLTPLEELLTSMQSGVRSGVWLTHSPWSAERVVVKSVPPRVPRALQQKTSPGRGNNQ